LDSKEITPNRENALFKRIAKELDLEQVGRRSNNR